MHNDKFFYVEEIIRGNQNIKINLQENMECQENVQYQNKQ